MNEYLRRFTRAVENASQLAHLHLLAHQALDKIDNLEVTMSALSDAIAQNDADVQSLISALKAAQDLAAKYAGEPEAAEINDAVAKLTADHAAVADALKPADAASAADASAQPVADNADASDVATPSDSTTTADAEQPAVDSNEQVNATDNPAVNG